MGFSYNGQPSGGGAIPDFAVATFSALPESPPDGYLVAVTGELDIDGAIVRWEVKTGWTLERGFSKVSLPNDGIWYTGKNAGDPVVSSSTVALVTSAGEAYEWTGSSWKVIGDPKPPTVTVANFADLAGILDLEDGALVKVTEEPGLAETIVRWDDINSVWLLERCTSATLPPLQGEWFNQSVGMTLVVVESAAGAFCACADLLYRWNTGVKVSEGAGGGSIPFWLPQDVYQGSPEVAAWVFGKEDVTTDAVLNSQGFSGVTRTRATIATDPDNSFIRFENTAESGLKTAQIKAMTSGVDSTTRVYSAIQVRGELLSATGGDIAFQILGGFFDGTNGVKPAISSHFLTRGAFFWTGTASNIAGSVVDNNILPDLSSDGALIEAIYTPGLGLARLYRDGVLIATCTRPASEESDQFTIGISAGTDATNITKLDLRFARVITW